MNPRYLVSVEFENIRAEIWVNRIPVGAVALEDGSPIVFPVNQFLMEGSNQIGTLLNFGPVAANPDAAWNTEPEAQNYHGPASLALKIALYQPEQVAFRDHPPVLADIIWNGIATPQPQYTEKQMNVSRGGERWAWESATAFTAMDVALRSSAIDYITYLHNLLVQRRFDTFMAESAVKFDEMARAYGTPMGPFRDAMMQRLQKQEPEHLAPLNRDTLDLRLIAKGRMVECLRRGRKQVLEYEQPDSKNTFFLPLMIGQIQGKWKVLR